MIRDRRGQTNDPMHLVLWGAVIILGLFGIAGLLSAVMPL